MNAAIEPQNGERGASLLLEHCTALEAASERLSAHERLERALGSRLASMLVGALSGGSRRRSDVG
jgi:hypothetical protein